MNHWPSSVSNREMVAFECHCLSDLEKHRQVPFSYQRGNKQVRVTFLTYRNTKLTLFEHYVPCPCLSSVQVSNHLILRNITIIVDLGNTANTRQGGDQTQAMCLKDHPLLYLYCLTTP